MDLFYQPSKNSISSRINKLKDKLHKNEQVAFFIFGKVNKNKLVHFFSKKKSGYRVSNSIPHIDNESAKKLTVIQTFNMQIILNFVLYMRIELLLKREKDQPNEETKPSKVYLIDTET